MTSPKGICSSAISRKFLIKYYEHSFDYPITITNQLTINTHTYIVYSTVCSLQDTDLRKFAK